jgi:4-amino-4-deoxy-L-arabinose transferase-like glycosyltransferase
MIDLLIDLLLAALMLLALYGIGRVLRRLVRLPLWGRAADLAYAFAFGLGAVVTLLFGLALVGWLRPAVGWAVLVIGVILALAQHRMLRGDLSAAWQLARQIWRSSWFMRLAMLAAVTFAIVNLVADLAPPIEGDTVHQYLLTARYWVDAGHYVQPSHVWASTLPGNMMMLSAWALLLRHSYSLATLITGLGMSALLALGVYVLARLHFRPEVAVLAVVVIATVPDVGYLAQSAKVDLGWAFFETLALAALFRWLQAADLPNRESAPPARWLILAGLCLGLAAGSKNETVISGEWRRLLRAALVFGAAVIIVALPYYLYNGIAHHNPFYPVFADQFARWFGGTPSPRAELGTEVFYPWTVGGYLTNLWNASLGHIQPGFYLGFIAGPIFLLAIPLGLLLGLLRGEWKMLAYAFAFSIVWFLVKQAVRHFLPGLVLLAVVAGLVLWRVDRQVGSLRTVVLPVAAIILGWNVMNGVGVLYWSGAYRVALGIESREAFLQQWHDTIASPSNPDWATIQALNRLGPSARVLTEHASSPLYITPDLVSPNWGDRLAYETFTDPSALLAALADHHISYILVFNTDPDDRYLFTQPGFLAQHSHLIYSGPRTRLYALDGLEK